MDVRRLRWPAGTPAPLEDDEDDEVEQLLSSIRHAKGRLRELLAQRETQLRMAARLASVAAWRIRLAPLHFLPSAEWLQILECPPGRELSLAATLRLFARPVRASLQALFRDCVRQHAAFDLVVPVRSCRGRRLFLRLIGEPELDEEGTVLAVHGACQDVTDQLAREGEASRLALRLTTTLESLTEGFVMLDRNWRITYINAAAERTMQWRREEVLGRITWDIVPESLESVFHHEFEEALATNKARVFQDYWAPRGRWLEVRAYPSEQGLAIYFVDVTRQRALQEELDRHRRELEELVAERTRELRNINDELGAFTMAVAHDLRAPLAAIAGFGQALAERLPEGDGKSRHYLGRVQAGAARMEGMLAALIELARLGQAPLYKHAVDLSAIASEIVEGLRASEPDRRVDVEVQPGLYAVGDPVLLRTVLENLVGNAWKFTARQPAARIVFGRAADGEFFVGDNGAGFEMAHAANLFAPFQRLHTESEFPGTGVGLAAVRRVIQRHGGAIRADSRPGHGATFRFTLAS